MMINLRRFHKCSRHRGGECVYLIIVTLAFLLLLSNLKAVELSTICQYNNFCTINGQDITISLNQAPINQNIENSNKYGNVNINDGAMNSFTNNQSGSLLSVNITSGINSFYNYGSITNSLNISAHWVNSNIENYGNIGGEVNLRNITNVTILNKGTMGNIVGTDVGNLTLDYLSICKENCSVNTAKVVFKNYGLQITRIANDYNTSNNTPNNSHIVTGITNASFYDANSKIILDFGGNFEFGKEYSLNRIILGNNNSTALFVDFYRLTLQNPDIYKLTQNGEYFIVNELSGGEIHTPITDY